MAVTGQERGHAPGNPGVTLGIEGYDLRRTWRGAVTSTITADVSELAAGNIGDDMTDPSAALDGQSGFCVDYMSSTQAPQVTALSGRWT